MPKEKSQKKGAQLRHTPLGTDIDNIGKQVKPPRSKAPIKQDDEEEETSIPQTLGSQIFDQAREQRMEMTTHAESNSKLNDDSDFDVTNTTNIMF